MGISLNHFFYFFNIPTFCLRLSHVLIHKRLAIRYTTILTLAILLILIQLTQKNKIKWSSQAKLPDRDALTPIIYHIYIMGSQKFYRYHTNSISYRDPPFTDPASSFTDPTTSFTDPASSLDFIMISGPDLLMIYFGIFNPLLTFS